MFFRKSSQALIDNKASSNDKETALDIQTTEENPSISLSTRTPISSIIYFEKSYFYVRSRELNNMGRQLATEVRACDVSINHIKGNKNFKNDSRYYIEGATRKLHKELGQKYCQLKHEYSQLISFIETYDKCLKILATEIPKINQLLKSASADKRLTIMDSDNNNLEVDVLEEQLQQLTLMDDDNNYLEVDAFEKQLKQLQLEVYDKNFDSQKLLKTYDKFIALQEFLQGHARELEHKLDNFNKEFVDMMDNGRKKGRELGFVLYFNQLRMRSPTIVFAKSSVTTPSSPKVC